MITSADLDEAIAECVGKRRPDANDCIKLAAFYTIRNQLYPKVSDMPSFSAPRTDMDLSIVDFQGASEFSKMVDGRKQSEIWPVIDELMSTLEAINPRLYDAVFRKLS